MLDPRPSTTVRDALLSASDRPDPGTDPLGHDGPSLPVATGARGTRDVATAGCAG